MMRRNFLVVATATLTLFVMPGIGVSADPPNPRMGRWRNKSDAPPPSSNIMTYEPYGKKGMINHDRSGRKRRQGYEMGLQHQL